jgi:hypothetical protein
MSEFWKRHKLIIKKDININNNSTKAAYHDDAEIKDWYP